MPAISSVTIADGAATPVNHTFIPDGESASGWVLVEAGASPVSDKRLVMNLNRNVGNNRRIKTSMKLVIPVVQTQTIDGISNPVVVRTAYADVTFTYDENSLPAERKDARVLLANALGHNMFVAQNDTLQGLY